MQLNNIYVDGTLSNITVDNGIITAITKCERPVPEVAVRWALPSMANMHTHSAMTLMRSVGNGLPLSRWLNECIFPLEAKLTPDDIYRGTVIACNEMRNTGTTVFNDMYFCTRQTIRAAAENGLRGVVSLSVTDNDFNKWSESELHQTIKNFDRITADLPKGIQLAIAPHSIYAVNGKNLKYIADFALEHNLPYHIHISETQTERENCIREHGVPPVIYLDKLGVLDKTGDRFIGAHALWLDETEIRLLGNHHANVVHCPNSNLKLGSGFQFHYIELCDAGVNVCLGTDGCASSDNLDMLEAMKIMSLLQKGIRHDPSVMPTEEAFKVASENGFRAIGLKPPKIAVGEQADFFLIDISSPIFDGIENAVLSDNERKKFFLDRLLYAAHSDCIINFNVTLTKTKTKMK